MWGCIMKEFIIVETDDGLTIATQEIGQDAAATAAAMGALLVESGPYRSYEEAYDAMQQIPVDAEEEAAEEQEGS
jgi:predicted regulator of Ras-like GTPase activity (Roadblock/LC7/MglB family)